MNRLTSLATTHVPTSALVQSYAFTLGPAGNRTRIDEPDGPREYSYDALYRLTGETVAGLFNYAKTFSYDPVGNRLTQATTGSDAPTPPGTVSYTYDSRDRLVSDSTGLTYSYDANGNLTSGTSFLGWDFDGRLAFASALSGACSITPTTPRGTACGRR